MAAGDTRDPVRREHLHLSLLRMEAESLHHGRLIAQAAASRLLPPMQLEGAPPASLAVPAGANEPLRRPDAPLRGIAKIQLLAPVGPDAQHRVRDRRHWHPTKRGPEDGSNCHTLAVLQLRRGDLPARVGTHRGRPLSHCRDLPHPQTMWLGPNLCTTPPRPADI